MTLRKVVPFVVAAALITAAGWGAFVYQKVSASATTQTNPLVASHGRGPGGGFSDENLANALGISLDELNAAYTEATDAALTQAVEQGLITQAQADQILSNMSGKLFPGFGGMGRMPGDRGFGEFGRHGGWSGAAPSVPDPAGTEMTPSIGL